MAKIRQYYMSVKAITLKDIRNVIDNDLILFEQRFKDAVATPVPLLNRIMYYIVRRRGKQMRPMFVFFAALLGGNINEQTYRGAALVELLHTATLIHDDVVDDANERRGFFSINALWKNKVAVLVGDYILSKGLLLAINNNDFHLLKIVSKAVQDMSEGELLQMERSRRLNLDEEVYFEIITKKTASLIASACAVGCSSTVSNVNPSDPLAHELIAKAWVIGEKIGIAFQIRDDLFDFGAENIGKPKGIDIKEKKITLPLMYAINHASNSDRRHIVNTIKRHHNNKEKVAEVIDFVWQSGGIAYAQDAMHRYKEEALQLLQEFPNGEGRTGLEQLIWFTIERKK